MLPASPKILKTSQTSLGKLLRIYRERAEPRLTQSRLGELVGVSDKTIRNWEDDLSVPTLRNLKRLIQVFLEQSLFTPEQEQTEALELWRHRQDLDEHNLFADFDTAWFQTLQRNLKMRPSATIVRPNPNLKQTYQLKAKVKPFLSQLPTSLTSLVGREKELAQITTLLSSSKTRLLTLSGIGGVGKTRLALELGHLVQAQFKDGVFSVPLAAIYDPEILSTTVAQSLNLRLAGGESQLNILREYLREKQLLLILDNFEQLVEGGAIWLYQLLEQLPRLKCIVTSRQLLNVSGEIDFQVEPLPTPRQTDTALQNESVQLFLERVKALKPAFELTPQNAATIVELCQRLEGIPLAIELAAARIQILTPLQMLDQLGQRFSLLKGQRRNGLERHRTLWAALDWSYQLLSPQLQTFFTKLAVFYGGWTLEAATAICEEPLALDLLTQLQQSSLLITQEINYNSNARAEVRFSVLETLREFALAQLNGPALQDLEQKYIKYYRELADQIQTRGPQGAFWLERLDYEHDNLRRSICISLKADATAETGLEIAADLGEFWYVRGHLEEGRKRLKAALAHTPVNENISLRARALNGEGCLAWRQGDYPAARNLLEQSLDLQRAIGDKIGAATSLLVLGRIASAQDDLNHARSLLEQSLELWRQVGNKHKMSEVLNEFGYLMLKLNDIDSAQNY